MRKAQTATEYLIILAVVIIIGLIVVGVLGVIPGIGGGASSSANSAFWQTATIGMESVSMVSTDNDTIIFKNNLPSSITVYGIWVNTTVSDRDGDAGVNLLEYGLNEANITEFTLSSGQTKTFLADILPCANGETVTFYTKIEYEDLSTSSIYNFSAQDNAYETLCAGARG